VSAPGCEREPYVLAALRGNGWSDGLRAHVAGCPACAETAFVAGALLDDARAAATEAELPDPGRIWLDARRRALRLGAARALAPIVLVRRVAAACGLAMAVALVAWLQPAAAHWLGWLRPPAPDVASGLAFVQGVLLLAACGGFLVVAAYALLTAWRQP